jgi:hypothetical protein
MNEAFKSLSFADLSAIKYEVYQKMERLKSKFPDELHKEETAKNLSEGGRLTVFLSNVCAEIDARIADAVTAFFNGDEAREDKVKNLIYGSSIFWLIENAKSEKMSALGMSERALSDANEVAEDLSRGGRHDRAIAIHRLIRAFFLSLDDVTFPKLDNG